MMMGANNPIFGKPRSIEDKIKSSKSLCHISEENIKTILEMVERGMCISEIGKATGLPAQSIGKLLNGKILCYSHIKINKSKIKENQLNGNKRSHVKKVLEKPNYSVTVRNDIKEMISKGFSRSQIQNELRFSESLLSNILSIFKDEFNLEKLKENGIKRRLRINPQTRELIKTLRNNDKLPIKKIVEITGVCESQIARIAKGLI